jgi:hypothetical protein
MTLNRRRYVAKGLLGGFTIVARAKATPAVLIGRTQIQCGLLRSLRVVHYLASSNNEPLLSFRAER